MWAERAVVLLFVLIGLLNLLPVVGVQSAAKLQSAYGLSTLSPDLTLLLRHRAVLFGLLGGLILCAAFMPALRWTALVLAPVSMGSFIVLAAGQEALNRELQAVVVADWIGLGLWALLAGLMLWNVRSQMS